MTPQRVSRRLVIKRLAVGAGGVLVGVAALAVADADREDTGQPIFSRQRGVAGPHLVFLPGIGATTRYWDTVVGTLAQQRQLTFIDLLGFGRSQKPWTTYSVDRHVAELARVITPMARDGPVSLVGHSLGARLAVIYASRYPDQVRQLILIGLPYFGGGKNAQAFIRQRSADGWLWTHMIPFALSCLLGRRVLGWAAPLMARDVPRAVAEDLNQMTWRSSTSTMWEVMYRYDLTPDIQQLSPAIRVTCLHGDLDRSAPLGGVLRMATLRPDLDVRVFPGGDHQLPLRHSAWVREQIATLTRS